jgi:hypothetical protein
VTRKIFFCDTIEELPERNSSDFVLESREYGRRDPLRWLRNNPIPAKVKLALTSPTIVHSWTQATEFVFMMQCSLVDRLAGRPRNTNFFPYFLPIHNSPIVASWTPYSLAVNSAVTRKKNVPNILTLLYSSLMILFAFSAKIREHCGVKQGKNQSISNATFYTFWQPCLSVTESEVLWPISLWMFPREFNNRRLIMEQRERSKDSTKKTNKNMSRVQLTRKPVVYLQSPPPLHTQTSSKKKKL